VFSKSFTQPARFVESTCCLVLYLAEKRKTKKQSQKNYKEGVIFRQRTADTYNARSAQKTHRTKMVERGIIFPERIAETRSVENPKSPSSMTRVIDKCLIFTKKIAETDKDKSIT